MSSTLTQDKLRFEESIAYYLQCLSFIGFLTIPPLTLVTYLNLRPEKSEERVLLLSREKVL